MESDTSKAIVAIVAALILVITLVFMVDALGIYRIQVFEKARKDAKREVFENTESYVNSMRDDIYRYRLEWVQSDSVSKVGIESYLRNKLEGFDEEKYLTDDEIKTWIKQIKRGN